MEQIGPIMILEGPKHSKVPYSRSLFIDCPEKVLIDSGADANILLEMNQEYGINLIINTHYHPDHTRHNYLFKDAKKWINPIEFETARTLEGVARANGVYQELEPLGFKQWKQSLPQEWVQNLGEISGTYEYETDYSFGDVKVIFLHTPGHTSGLSCPYFPDEGVVFVGDYDMTSFGPWYNGTDGDIEDFIASGKRLLTLDADIYITGHQKGIFSKQQFGEAMKKFLDIIDRRDETIEQCVRQGLTFEEITNIGIFYPRKSLENPILTTWERSGIRKHLHRLGISLPESTGELVKAK
ncbi:MBL fold metallo-hydrolase [Neobacillus sp. NPDC097160]|uniref:MBL fold metallo-hydrolase n=1 Tax=Neobacillus sp. NPDC097160 TaxID=3364298 RepID=UPI0037FD1FC6